jgi:5-methylcytosine-specific restriction endonuclease McrA
MPVILKIVDTLPGMTRCLYCGKEIDAGKNRKKFCNLSHSHEYRRKSPNKVCAHCGLNFYKNPKKITKSGLHFCSRECKDAEQIIGGKIEPAHYGTGYGYYREAAFIAYPHRCNVCGYSKYPDVLIAHHIDRNRLNNQVSNLELLCPTCHDEKHYLTKTGRWTQLAGV